MTRSALMLAFHFPPFAQSSGGLRTLSFVRHLPDHDWHPIVLTARDHVYPEVDPRSLAMVPPRSEIVRAPGLDIARHLSIAGRYPLWLAMPDRWNTWALGAFIAGLVCIRRHDPAVLWATFPIASALVASMALHKFTKVPLIVDLRDPLVYEGWPDDPRTRATYGKIEKRLVTMASAIVVTTPGARRLYIERYPHLPVSRFRIIANGIDESIDAPSSSSRRAVDEPIVLIHSGLMEVPDRDPTAFFEALSAMLRQGDIAAGTLRVVLRAPGREQEYRRQIAMLGIGAVVFIEERVSRPQAIDEMRRADGLLLFQGAQCNRQIPAKAYEYLACRRPIIGLVDSSGDTHELIAREWQVPYVADMESVSAIARVLRKFIGDLRRHDVFIPAAGLVEKHSRAAGAAQLAELFDEVSGGVAHD
jgi:glycosyltransferase involved in cell wall biosynthesis